MRQRAARDLASTVTTAGTGEEEALVAYGWEGSAEELAPFVEARRLQLAVWTAFLAEHGHPHLRERAEERLSRWP